MKISKFRAATAGLIAVVGFGVIGIVATTKPEAAEPLIWALVFMGLARVAAAVVQRRRQDRPALSGSHDRLDVTHGEIA